MHSHDRTLLAKLGFQDPDKSDARHDLAISYLNRQEILTQLLARVFIGRKHDGCTVVKTVGPGIRTEAEFHIEKGSGQYATTVGFADLIAVADVVFEHPKTGEVFKSKARLLVEVKINHVSVGDLLRQLKLYKSHIKTEVVAVAACAFPLAAADIDLLKSEGVHYVLLGEKFKTYCAERDQQKGAAECDSAKFEI